MSLHSPVDCINPGPSEGFRSFPPSSQFLSAEALVALDGDAQQQGERDANDGALHCRKIDQTPDLLRLPLSIHLPKP